MTHDETTPWEHDKQLYLFLFNELHCWPNSLAGLERLGSQKRGWTVVSIMFLQLCLGLVAVTELLNKIFKIWQKRVFKQC